MWRILIKTQNKTQKKIMTKAKLYVFSISHYCEKAKWALEACDIDYELKVLIPATYAKTAKTLGASANSVPIFEASDGAIVQGSATISEWANAQNEALLINDESRAIEQRLDDVLGVHIRRWFYSEALLDDPARVKPVFALGASILDKILLHIAWPKVVPVMIKRMDLGPAQELESKALVETELDWLDQRLSDGRRYLVGDRLSNADIAAASLIAPAFGPPQHPLDSVFELPPRIAETSKSWGSRPIAHWLMALYENHR